MAHPQPPSGHFEGRLHLFPVRVYYEDTDLSGIVYHANYLRWFERARSDMLRLLDINQRAALEAGEGNYAVADIAIRFALPARLDDAIIIETRATELRAASVRLQQRALRMDGEEKVLLAEADIRVGFVSPQGRPRRQPAAWRDAFAPLLDVKDAE
ncbi:acyl-CoA thioester hydrolase [Altererythrobacter atlanticus]|uniref:Acyl-CoA thioester hydrolase YbgC n=1 Tax=Croceibacterium atlanticum TaxID=1267766 RepID=A0A0F7KXZ3_9SPHN|nr:YbgC/FadM family acyl-CoA thioesterase [Croceibacterium atlanticum]AKH44087.1 Acyl-CoA thioester hydrolase YbgC [Croceibacterium atlanticum]MBB5732397.1 acyl-CoA thioester hydrolase [Croceibacterium atlanticum]